MIYTVMFAVEARQDFAALYDYILPRGGERAARDYVAKIYGYCLGFETFPERGTLRNDIRPGLRRISPQGYHCLYSIRRHRHHFEIVLCRARH